MEKDQPDGDICAGQNMRTIPEATYVLVGRSSDLQKHKMRGFSPHSAASTLLTTVAPRSHWFHCPPLCASSARSPLARHPLRESIRISFSPARQYAKEGIYRAILCR